MPKEKPLAVGELLDSARNQYQIKRLVGGGGMAWVYQVVKLDDNSLWALKELRPQTQDPDTQQHARQLFNQEAMILAQLNHPNLPQVIDFFEQNGRAYLVMEFIWGESLEKRIEKAHSPLLEREVLQWAIQICDVLDYLHTRQPPIIFRDLKPSNVMVNSAGVIKLVDFGIARTYKEGKQQDTIALGSENYAAPEQWGEEQTDPRSDLYGLGATMYHLLANMPPSPAFLPAEPTPLNELNAAVSPRVVEVVSKAMSRDRTKRYPSAAAMKQALLDCLPNHVTSGQVKESVTAAALHASPSAASQLSQSNDRTTPPAISSSSLRHSTPSQPTTPPVRQVVRRVRICPHCQHKNAIEARFCVKCGYAFVGLRPAVLRVIAPVRAAWEMPVKANPLMLGRADPSTGYRPDFDMTFYDPEGYVSRRHAHIVKAQNGYFIKDLGSSNGTYVNGQPLTPDTWHKLNNGDKIEIGEVGILFLFK